MMYMYEIDNEKISIGYEKPGFIIKCKGKAYHIYFEIIHDQMRPEGERDGIDVYINTGLKYPVLSEDEKSLIKRTVETFIAEKEPNIFVRFH